MNSLNGQAGAVIRGTILKTGRPRTRTKYGYRGVSARILTLAARVRKGELSRQAALEEYSMPRPANPELETYVRKRVGLSEAEYAAVMAGPKRNWKEFRTYKRRFERLRPAFKLLADAQLVPKTLYLKYCFPFKPKT